MKPPCKCTDHLRTRCLLSPIRSDTYPQLAETFNVTEERLRQCPQCPQLAGGLQNVTEERYTSKCAHLAGVYRIFLNFKYDETTRNVFQLPFMENS